MEKEYKVIFEKKQHAIDFIIPLCVGIPLLFFLINGYDTIDKIVGSEGKANVEIMAILGYIVGITLFIIFALEFIGKVNKWSKEHDKGEIVTEELSFKGKLKEIREVKYPKKYKTIYKTK